ncbi:MAG: STAS domain-containing protein [Candidatus Gracilibacteria bacterium]|nr:STAS domain-containing protein [Candidatus Gracilibacteria bacterium]
MNTQLEIVMKIIDDISIYELIGEIDETNADNTFKEIFDTFFGKKIIYDLGQLTHGNSKFIGYLINMNEFIEEKGGKMYIANCIDPLKDILELAGIDKMINMSDTLEKAIIEINSDNTPTLFTRIQQEN